MGRADEVAISVQASTPGTSKPRSDRVRLVSMMGLYYLVLVAVGILRPVRNALALDSRAEGDFYQVYLLSALVVLFAPIFNHLSDRVRWRTLIPATAAFFALNLVVFRAVYSEGSTVFGVLFYGWYDLFSAALITQFFMAVQVFFNARDAKAAIPLVIAAGSLGAVSGGVITGWLSPTLGTANMMLVAAAFVTAFAVALPFLWTGYPPVRAQSRGTRTKSGDRRFAEEFLTIFANRHIRLIAGLVLVTVLVKQIVDYEFQEAVRVFLDGDTDAISSFQGYVFAVKDFLPIVVLLPLGPLLKRYGIGLAVLMLPVFMLGSTIGLAVAFGVWTATVAKVGDSMFRYSAERTAREILYVPVPTDLKLKAKSYVDAAVEKGLGKVLSAVLIGVFSAFMDYRSVTWLAVVLAIVWCYMAWSAKNEYGAVLAESIRGRFANLDGGFASLTERSTLAMVETALRSEDTVAVGFGLDLVEQAGSVGAKHLADELELLLGHDDEDVRVRSLRLLARFPELVDAGLIRATLRDESPTVAEAAVEALAAGCSDEAEVERLLGELLESPDESVRLAVLAWLLATKADTDLAHRLASGRVGVLLPGLAREDAPGAVVEGAPVAVRRELALASGLMGAGLPGAPILARLLDDGEEEVSRLAMFGAGRVGSTELRLRLVRMLADPAVRSRAKEGLLAGGAESVELCRQRLADPQEEPSVRCRLAEILARVPDQRTVDALQSVVSEAGASWALRYAALKALNKLRASAIEVDFDESVLLRAVDRAVDEAGRYRDLAVTLSSGAYPEQAAALLGAAAREAWSDRREGVFRLLGLVFPPDDLYRSHGTLGGADDRRRANALEWLERTLGHALFKRVLSVLDGHPAEGLDRPGVQNPSVADFSKDQDPWIAELATRAGVADHGEGDAALDLIAKAFLLQKVDLLEGARSAHLGLLATIAEEVEADPGEVLVQSGEPNDALYVIMRGSAELSGVGGHTLTAQDGTAFGTWALIDSAPSVVGARALEHTRLLRITRSDFQELLSDHPELATGMLQALARRLRSLVA